MGQRTFLSAAGDVLWAWQEAPRPLPSQYGLYLVNKAHASLRSAKDAQALFDNAAVGCEAAEK